MTISLHANRKQEVILTVYDPKLNILFFRELTGIENTMSELEITTRIKSRMRKWK
jgi:hypothetical protein